MSIAIVDALKLEILKLMSKISLAREICLVDMHMNHIKITRHGRIRMTRSVRQV